MYGYDGDLVITQILGHAFFQGSVMEPPPPPPLFFEVLTQGKNLIKFQTIVICERKKEKLLMNG